ncbi:MAG: LL-diaminopimelate aminotransferase [Patescibacteria group bacterium]|nr:LL-diaminopimelate aminotransferase [Patescibacteria group bacterium]MDE2590871.1 LL-diaminopimelate aminotransferase [Patescibacteria group bacterium]
MAIINKHFKKLQGSYLFSEVAKRTNKFRQAHPDVQIFSLGIGNTTQPLPKSVINGLLVEVQNLASHATYRGYGDEQGNTELRTALSQWYLELGILLHPEEIFINDGAKSDLANILALFERTNMIAVQDPVYPAYIDSSVIAGYSGAYKNGRYKRLIYMPCTPENNFFPVLPEKKADVIYLCSPNNPTGAVATKKQLQQFVEYAITHKSVIIFDGAYSSFIQDSTLPKSIYEIEGAKTCAIEINSFSKYAGFTGVRLGWTVVPRELVIEDTLPGEIHKAWNRRQTTMFNGASNIAQSGGLAALSPIGRKECKKITDYYLTNAQRIRECLNSIGLSVIGGENAPYVWAQTPAGMSSWDFFDMLLNQAQVVSTPGVGFGPHGEGYMRFSAFGQHETTGKAINSIQQNIHI